MLASYHRTRFVVSTIVDPAHLIREISVLIILVMVGAYVSAQMVATGKAFGSFAGMNYTVAVIFGASIITSVLWVATPAKAATYDLCAPPEFLSYRPVRLSVNGCLH